MVDDSILLDVTVEASYFLVALRRPYPYLSIGSLLSSRKQGGYVAPLFLLLRSGWSVKGSVLSMHGKNRSSGYFSSRVSPRIQSSRVSSRILLTIAYEFRTGSPVSESHVVILILSFSCGENNCRIESPCYLERYEPILTMRL